MDGIAFHTDALEPEKNRRADAFVVDMRACRAEKVSANNEKFSRRTKFRAPVFSKFE